MKIASLINGLFGFALGYYEGTDNYDATSKGVRWTSRRSIEWRIFRIIWWNSIGIPLGYFYGIISKGKMNYIISIITNQKIFMILN